MSQLDSLSTPPARHLVRVTVVAILLPGLVACSAEVPQDAPELGAAPAAASPFSRQVDPSGCVIERITMADHDEYQVQGASADGRTLSMTARLEGANEAEPIERVHEIDLATGTTTDLPAILKSSGAFSPDGRFNVLAQATDNGKTDIFEFERATGELRPVAPHEDWDWFPSYSPDGRFILFGSYRVGGQSDIHVFEKATGTLRRLTAHPGYDAHAQFSPDGKRIVFHRQRGTRDEGGYIFDLMVHELETGRETRLTDGDFEESYPAWAPDGAHIVYSSDSGGQHGKHNLYVLAPDGETTIRLTRGDWKDDYAFWSPDGNFIYFNSDRAGSTNIYRMLMEGVGCWREGA